MDDSDKPKRRVRYKGTHPRKHQEKYKELNIEKYTNDVEKIIARGATPVGTHRPICVNEILDFLDPKPGHIVLDATLGYGGHTEAILNKILPGGHLIGLDQDPVERPKTELRLRKKGYEESVLTIGALNFCDAKSFLEKINKPQVNLILADLGLSSMQIDNPDRGFSLKFDQPLDLRMNPETGMPAADFIQTLSEERLATLLEENSDEPRARQIAKAIIKQKPTTTHQLVSAVKEAIKSFSPRVQKEEGDAPIRRAFQAIRIAINDEFRVLDKFLSDLPKILKPDGKVAILSFHSGEDRRVKKSFQALHREGLYREISAEPLRASFDEQRSNPRSKPAKLRWAIRR